MITAWTIRHIVAVVLTMLSVFGVTFVVYPTSRLEWRVAAVASVVCIVVALLLEVLP